MKAKARQKKKIVELNQGKTLTKTELNVVLLFSAILLSVLVFVQTDFLNTANFTFDFFPFLIGILISLVNFRAWKNLINGISVKDKWLVNTAHFLIQKTAVILAAVIIIFIGKSSFLISTLLGFSAHLGLSLFLIMLCVSSRRLKEQ